MSKLNQVIAIEKGVKARVYGHITDLYKVIQKAELFNGFSKIWQKKDDVEEEFPPESQRVQFVVSDVLRTVERSTIELMDVVARKDWANCKAKGSIMVDGQVIVPDVPVTYLLFLEKQLNDLQSFVSHLPVLDSSYDWSKDENSGLFKTDPTLTSRTKKVPKPIVLYPATAEHPAQTQVFQEDVIIGHWNTTKQSGAIPKVDKERLLERVIKLLTAVKEAREQANNIDEIEVPKAGTAIFTYLIG